MPKTLLKLELFAATTHDEVRLYHTLVGRMVGRDVADEVFGRGCLAKPWVAEICGRDGRFGYARQFLRPRRDYRQANGKGTRGVFLVYFLTDGRLHEVQAQESWKRWERYFCIPATGELQRLGKQEADQWLNDHSA